MWKKIALGIGALVVVFVAFVAMQPSAFTIERSVAIEAPADVVYGHIQSLRAMDEWSPWVRMDPNLKLAYDGPEAGVGARSSWEGPQMGKGRLTITAVKPEQEVDLELEMLAPMAATNRVVFTLAAAGGTTNVTWRMDGTNGFVGKAIGLFVDMDDMVGGPFEQGLAALKTLAEAEAAQLARR